MSKNVLITGASGGFGTLTTKLLLQKGYAVVATMRNASTKNKDVAAELQAAGAKIVEIDVTSTDSVNAGVQKAIELLGSLDIVINNAGVGCAGMIEHFTPEDMQRLFDINVFGIQRINRAVLPHMRQQGSGLIVYISSLLGRITMPFYGIYNASKWALEALSEAADLGGTAAALDRAEVALDHAMLDADDQALATASAQHAWVTSVLEDAASRARTASTCSPRSCAT